MITIKNKNKIQELIWFRSVLLARYGHDYYDGWLRDAKNIMDGLQRQQQGGLPAKTTTRLKRVR